MTASTIAVTAATGHLGRLVVASLLERGVDVGRIVATTRDATRADDLRSRGIDVREADYTRWESLESALEGVERLLLVSGTDVGERVAQHENVVRAAGRAGVGMIAYTSIVNADRSTIALADDHKATEEIIRGSGLPYVMLRNSWYFENYQTSITQAATHGVIIGSAGHGRLSAATRADYAAAAATVLADDSIGTAVYELGGDEAFTMDELAAEVGRRAGREVVYQDLPAEEYATELTGLGVPAGYARALADSDLGIARGELFTNSGDLHRLIGRPTTRLTEYVATVLPSPHG